MPTATLEAQKGLIQVGSSVINILEPEGVCLLPIEAYATALARIPRFGGHTRQDLPAYNVALHSIGVQILLEEMGTTIFTQMFGLIHDLSEAVLLDIPSPLKRSPVFEMYRELEGRWEEKLYVEFAGRKPEPEEKELVKFCDNQILQFEVRNFMEHNRETEDHWGADMMKKTDIDKLLRHFLPLGEQASRVYFLRKYAKLAKILRSTGVDI